MIINQLISKPIFFINITIYSYYIYLCLNLTSGQIGIAIPITPVVTPSSTVATAAAISAMNKTNSRQYVHFIQSNLENSPLSLQCSSTSHVPYGGMEDCLDCMK